MNDRDLLKIKLNHLEINDREKLINDIRDFIVSFFNKNKKIDNKLVYELLELLIDVRKLKNYVKELNSYNLSIDNELDQGVYYPCSFSIEIYLYNIMKKYKYYQQLLNPYLKELLYIFRVFSVCFHEIEHANQIKMCQENNNSIETLILRNSMKYLPNKEFEMLLINKGYNAFQVHDLIEIKEDLEYDCGKYYDINPSERLADIKTAFIGICSLEKYLEEFPRLKNELYYYLFESLYRGYTQYSNPTEVFIKKYDKINELELIKTKIECLTILEKSAYGMKLNNNEKKSIQKKKKLYADKILNKNGLNLY